MNDMAWFSISIRRLQLHNFGCGMTAIPVYANIMRVSPLAVVRNYSFLSRASRPFGTMEAQIER